MSKNRSDQEVMWEWELAAGPCTDGIERAVERLTRSPR
jgi:hypothetical protein